MAKSRKGFRGLSEVAALSDDRARLLALGNWHKLNTVLRTKPSVADLQRLLALEVAQGRGARANFLERLRSAVSQARSRESRRLVKGAAQALKAGERVPATTLVALGLAEEQARRLGK